MNGQDVSKASHEDAVRAFQSAQEPIVVEVLRRAAAGGLRNDANRNPKPSGETNSDEVRTTAAAGGGGRRQFTTHLYLFHIVLDCMDTYDSVTLNSF